MLPMKTSEDSSRRSLFLPIGVALVALALWHVLCAIGWLPDSAVPAPLDVAKGFVEEAKRGRLFDDIIASLFRVSVGFLLAVAMGIPLGLWMGLRLKTRVALLPAINFFRSLSPLAWIPFAILWFGIGDKPAIFLIFMAAFFPVVLATMAAVSNIPAVYFRVARDYGFRGAQFLSQVTLPAIMPQVITSLRVTAGLSWLVVVAAEMIAGQDGLGFLIWDARNALRPDLLVVGMVVIGLIGVTLDRLLVELTRIPSVRWGYDK
jgi:NitT/TauT family transport system permease protein